MHASRRQGEDQMRCNLRSKGAVFMLAATLSVSLPAQQAATADIEPEAIEALNRMGAYLRTLRSFQVDSAVTGEIVLTNGMKVQYGQKATILAKLPDRLRAQIEGDKGTHFYLFDGKTFT